MPKIENVSADDVRKGYHMPCKGKSMLIQIVDTGGTPPTPKASFNEAYSFEFLDVEKDSELSEFGITQSQADQIKELLARALKEGTDVVVHCTAGLCRSGAVVEVAEMMGFEKCYRTRFPNLMVKHSLMKSLGLTYSSDEEPYVVNPADEHDIFILPVFKPKP